MRTLGNFGGPPHLYMSGTIDYGLIYITDAPDSLWINLDKPTPYWRVTPLVFGYFYFRLCAAEDKLTDYDAFRATAKRWQAIWDYCRGRIDFTDALRAARGVGKLPPPPTSAINDNLIPVRDLDRMIQRARDFNGPPAKPPDDPFARRQYYLARGMHAEKQAKEAERHERKMAYLRSHSAIVQKITDDDMPF